MPQDTGTATWGYESHEDAKEHSIQNNARN